jgi:hypothetical protein
MSIKFSTTASFGRNVKPSDPFRKILRQHVKEPYRHEKRYYAGKIHGDFSLRFASRRLCWLLPELWWMHQEWSELRWRRTSDQIMVAVRGTPCASPPRKSNGDSTQHNIPKLVWNSASASVCYSCTTRLNIRHDSTAVNIRKRSLTTAKGIALKWHTHSWLQKYIMSLHHWC